MKALVLILLLCVAGCGESKNVPPPYVEFITPVGVHVEVPSWVAARAEWPAALREINRTVAAFVTSWGPIPLDVIRFRGRVVNGPILPGDTAAYVGAGRIDASLNIIGSIRVLGLPTALGVLAASSDFYRSPLDTITAVNAATRAQY